MFLCLANYKYNENMYSIKEPGLGLMILALIVQFFVGTIIIGILEYKKKFNLKFTKTKSLKTDDDSLNEKVKFKKKKQLFYIVIKSHSL